MAGDVVYFTIPVADVREAQSFYGELFGWQFEPGNVPGGLQVSGSNPPGGLFESDGAGKPSVYFSVDDIHAAVLRIRELGGEAEEPQQIESGFMASCRDPRGTEFNLWAPRSD